MSFLGDAPLGRCLSAWRCLYLGDVLAWAMSSLGRCLYLGDVLAWAMSLLRRRLSGRCLLLGDASSGRPADFSLGPLRGPTMRWLWLLGNTWERDGTVLILVLVKFFALFLLDGSSLHQAGLKLTLMGLLGDILVLLLVEVFFVGVWRSLLVLSLCFLKFILLWLLTFMELYMLWKKFKRWGLLMYDLNVIMLWFMLHLLLELMFRGCFVIDGIIVLITVGKSSLGVTHFSWRECVCW